MSNRDNIPGNCWDLVVTWVLKHTSITVCSLATELLAEYSSFFIITHLWRTGYLELLNKKLRCVTFPAKEKILPFSYSMFMVKYCFIFFPPLLTNFESCIKIVSTDCDTPLSLLSTFLFLAKKAHCTLPANSSSKQQTEDINDQQLTIVEHLFSKKRYISLRSYSRPKQGKRGSEYWT